MTDSVERRIKDMSDMTRIFEQRGFEKGYKEGFEKGFKEGFKEGFEEGFKEGLEESRKEIMKKNIEALIETMRELGHSKESIIKQVEKRFSLTRNEAENAFERYLEE